MVHCKQANRAKVMVWVRIVDGKLLPVDWIRGCCSIHEDVENFCSAPFVVVLLRSSISSNKTEETCTVRPRCWTSARRSSGTESSPANPSTTAPLLARPQPAGFQIPIPDHYPCVQVPAHPAGTQGCGGRLHRNFDAAKARPMARHAR